LLHIIRWLQPTAMQLLIDKDLLPSLLRDGTFDPIDTGFSQNT